MAIPDRFISIDPPWERERLFETVVNGGYCIGCGACAAVPHSGVEISFDDFGRFQAVKSSSRIISGVLDACPFSERSANEDALAREVFSKPDYHSEELGYYMAIYAGYVADDGYRVRGSSGGMGTWILTQLLRSGLIDAVAHVKPQVPTSVDSRLFRYSISRTEDEIQAGAKSRYYPIEMSGVLNQIYENPGRYAVVGLPCFIKAVRLLAKQEKIFEERIRFTVALFCGHLKSARFGDLLAWQLGVPPGQLLAIDFRKKLFGRNADDYGVEAVGMVEGQRVNRVQPLAGLLGADWGAGYFKYHACDFCDDVVGETGDVAVGDAWLPEFVEDGAGTNVVIVRHPDLLSLVQAGIKDGSLKLQPLSAERAICSQAAGFRHRREGLSYRLYLSDNQQKWRPPKRVEPQIKHLKRFQRKRYRLRMELAELSHKAFRQAVHSRDIRVFMTAIKPLLEEYSSTDALLWRRVLGRFGRNIRGITLRLLGGHFRTT